MFTKLTFKALILVLVAVFSLSYVVYAAIAGAPAITDLDKLASEPGMKEHEFELTKPSKAPRLSNQEAIAKAKEIVGHAFGVDQAMETKAVYTLFTDNETPELPEKDILLRDIPVWIVTFEGLKIEPHGDDSVDTSKPNTQLHVVIDANTGEELEMFSYK